ncbi:BlaI/MecI/CopY family transcriptional regulator [Pedobacter sp. P26]|uniref:BlaI/MecI/CopY family transcriptional regulator n=1 Tax=Pedobacter sp. P26 TaxID=3423956 RepID=UPI003D665C73
MNILKFNDIERRIIEVLLDVPELSTKEIRQRMAAPVMAVSTISLALRLMENRLILNHRKTPEGYLYYVTFTRKDLMIRDIENICNKYFSGNVNEMIEFILSIKNVFKDKLLENTNTVASK